MCEQRGRGRCRGEKGRLSGDSESAPTSGVIKTQILIAWIFFRARNESGPKMID